MKLIKKLKEIPGYNFNYELLKVSEFLWKKILEWVICL